MSDAPNRIRVRQTFFETLDVKFPQSEARRGTTAATRAVWHPQAALEGRGQSALMSCVFRKDGTVVSLIRGHRFR
jgi:hypothetical protein